MILTTSIEKEREKKKKKKQEGSRKHFCFIDYAKAFDCVDHNKWWKVKKNK